MLQNRGEPVAACGGRSDRPSLFRFLHELMAKVLLYFGGGASAIHDNYQFFSAKQLQNGLCLGVIIL
jgi:hypothetical protein